MSKSKQRRCHRIPDGYTISGAIKGKEGIYDDLFVECRPFSVWERDQWMRYWRESRSEKPKRDAEFYAYQMSKLIAGRIIRWDAVDEAGNVLPIDANSVKSLHPGLHDDLTNVIIGEKALAQAEDAAAEESDPEYEAWLAETGMSRPEADAKNSSTAAA